MAEKAVVLLSGGLDSSTVLYMCIAQGLSPVALTFSYGQRHSVEIDRAADICGSVGVPQEVRHVELGGSALTFDCDVPKSETEGIPVTYVPARNIVFSALALSYAEQIGATEVWLGVNAVDYSGYPDCRRSFIQAMNVLSRNNTKSGVEGRGISFRAPLIDKTKKDILQTARNLGVPVEKTWSCYAPAEDNEACGECDSCRIRGAALES